MHEKGLSQKIKKNAKSVKKACSGQQSVIY